MFRNRPAENHLGPDRRWKRKRGALVWNLEAYGFPRTEPSRYRIGIDAHFRQGFAASRRLFAASDLDTIDILASHKLQTQKFEHGLQFLASVLVGRVVEAEPWLSVTVLLNGGFQRRHRIEIAIQRLELFIGFGAYVLRLVIQSSNGFEHEAGALRRGIETEYACHRFGRARNKDLLADLCAGETG